MTQRLTVAAALALVLAMGAALRAQETAFLAAFDLHRPAAVHRLPAALREVSGLAVTRDGRLYAHGDERAELVELDPATGRVVRRFTVGDPALRGDFEGLAIAGGRFFLVTAGATIVEFREGADRAAVPHVLHDTGLDGCEVEGLEHLPGDDALLLACKQSDRGAVVVHAFDLGGRRLESAPRLRIDRDAVRDAGTRQLHASGILRLPRGGLLLVAAREQALLEVAPDGGIRALRALDAERHPQAEGIALLRDGSLAIADEGGGGRGTLTIYRPRR